MKAEIHKRGPISCEMTTTKKFDEYKSGIYEESTFIKEMNHVVSVIGWGLDE